MSTEPKIVNEITAKIPFYPKLNSIPRGRRAPKAIRLLKEWVKRNMKVELENVLIAQEVNEEIWKRGIQKPPRYIYITAQKADDDVVEVILAPTAVIAPQKIVETVPSEDKIEEDFDEDEEEEEDK